ncbi:nucleotidyltransferase domain-containing protein [Neobacillus notoginsengisoli]|nr:nucleotidyltransferase domain-containing protein [Neobacillus notoginsengisoli]
MEVFPAVTLNDIREAALNHIECFLNTLEKGRFKPTIICMVGSRLNGRFNENSDLDIAIAYKGDLREDDCFNGLMEEPLFFDEIKVDFIPYSLDKGNQINFEKEYYILFNSEETVATNAKVKCCGCNEVTNKSEWSRPVIINKKFVGGCPICNGAFYEDLVMAGESCHV